MVHPFPNSIPVALHNLSLSQFPLLPFFIFYCRRAHFLPYHSYTRSFFQLMQPIASHFFPPIPSSYPYFENPDKIFSSLHSRLHTPFFFTVLSQLQLLILPIPLWIFHMPYPPSFFFLHLLPPFFLPPLTPSLSRASALQYQRGLIG